MQEVEWSICFHRFHNEASLLIAYPADAIFEICAQSSPVQDSCYNWFPRIQGGGPKEPDLAQLLGWALSHWVSDSLTDIFTGVLMMRF